MPTAIPQTVAPAPVHRSLAELVQTEKKRQTRRRLVWSLLGVGLVAGGGAAAFVAQRPHPVPLPARFRSEPVTQGDVVREARATGHVEAVNTVQIGAEISGRIATVEADFNSVVKAGQVLARFDRDALLAQQKQVEANLASARSTLAQSKTDREHTARELARAEQLRQSQSITGSEYDNAAAAARLAVQRVSAASAALAAQDAAERVAQTNLDHSVIHSPIDGVVITRNVDPGETLASMFQTPVLFTVAADLHKMRVIAAVDEADIGEVAVRQPTTFTVNAYPDRVFAGVVTEVRNSPVVVQDVVTYGAVVEVENPDLALKPGMTASARIRTAAATAALRVPAAALRFTPPGEKKADKPGVWVLEDGAVHEVAVTPGVTDGDQTAVTQTTLRPGQALLVDLTPAGKRAYGLAH
jgi:HlyD family secretion protein